MIGACNGWIIALDNVSHLSDWLSDGICRLATGGGFATRSLYTDSEETYLDATRPVIIASIEDVVRRGDLADRCVTLTLQPIPESKRRTEQKMWAQIDAEAPAIMGAILDALAGGLKQLPAVKLDRLPRMADFAVWGEAVCRGTGKKPGEFLDAYTANRHQANESVLEESAVAHHLRSMMALAVTGKWEGTSRDLLTDLGKTAGEKTVESKRWPKSPRALSGILRRLAPSLRVVGIQVGFERASHTRTRTITIEADPENACNRPSPPSAPSPASVLPGEKGDGRKDLYRPPTVPRPSPDRPPPSPPSPANPVKTAPGDAGDDGDANPPSLSGDTFDAVREVFEI